MRGVFRHFGFDFDSLSKMTHEIICLHSARSLNRIQNNDEDGYK